MRSRWPFERPKVSWDAPRRDDIAVDLYRILGLHPGASDKKIKATYRKLAKRLHPDVNASETATGRQIEINRAYEILGDPNAREAYDAELAIERAEARGRFWRGVAAGVVTFLLTASATSLVALLFMYSPLSRPESGERVLLAESVAAKSPEHKRITLGGERTRSDLPSSDVADGQAGKRSSTSEPTYQKSVSPDSEVGHVEPREKDRSDEPQAQPKPLVVPTPKGEVASTPPAALPPAETRSAPVEDKLPQVENLALPKIDDDQQRPAAAAPEATSYKPLPEPASDDKALTRDEPAGQPSPLLGPTPREVVASAPSVVPPVEETPPVTMEVKLPRGIENLAPPRIDDSQHPTPTVSTMQRAKSSLWRLYLNARSGFALKYPADVFPLATTNKKEDRLLTAKDRRAVLHIFSVTNGATTLPAYRQLVMAQRYAGASFDYTPQRGNWFVLSGTVGEEIFYERVSLSCDRRSIHGWVLAYPRAERAFYDTILAEIRSSYRHANARCGDL